MADVTITAANVLASVNAKKNTVVAGATITAGQPVYLDSAASNRAKLADANASAATSNVVGIALHGAADGQPLTYAYEDDDFTPGFTLSLSGIADDGVYVLSGTAGAIAPVTDLAAGMYPVLLHVAKSTTKSVLKIMRGGAVLV